MSYNFNPMTEEEINDAGLLENGVYEFEVLKSTRRMSKSGNPMAELLLNVWDKNGKHYPIYDYLVFSSIPLNIRKVKHFCDAVGLAEEYKQGSIPEELERYCGKVDIGTQDEQPKPSGGMYGKKNIVLDYVMTDKGAVKHESSDNVSDDVPF